jgi:hypothetical protein
VPYTVQTLASAKQALQAAADKVSVGWRLLQLLVLIILALFGLVLLAFLDYAINQGLWGEFIFAFVVTCTTIAILGHTIPDTWWSALHFTPPTTLQAPFWAGFLLIAVPIAAVTRPAGIALALGTLLVAYALIPWLLSRLNSPLWTQPSARLALLITVSVMLGFAEWRTTHSEKHRVPAASRRALTAGDQDLASRYRPVLFFDSVERFVPLNIGLAMTTPPPQDVQTCTKTVGGEHCDPVRSESQIDQNADYLKFPSEELGPGDSTGGRKSAYYYHLVDDRPPRVYIDYWWFFAENPEPVAGTILCRAGFRAPEASCFQHHADWEGITVVLAPCNTTPSVASECISFDGRRLHIVQVNYAQHNGVKPRVWPDLVKQWSDTTRGFGERPLVYVALNSHASYSTPCTRKCRPETRYDGRLAWDNNGSTCDDGDYHCLKPLPIDAEGQPALWNAFPGPWGSQHCILAGAVCDGGPAPDAPAFHHRYQRPDQTS